MATITVPYHYKPREYQLPLLKAMDNGVKRAVWVAHRRSGKDKTLINLCAKRMLERVGAYYYFLPTYQQGRKIVWEGRDKEGFKFLDHFPKELIKGKPNDTEMKLEYKNGSIFRVIGTDNINSIVGTNPMGCVFSEYSLQDPNAWDYIRPILAENEGWAVFVFTPRGENHGYDIYELARNNKDWFSQLLTVDDTQAIPADVLANERKEIIHKDGNDALYQQEYYCNFSVPLAGAYYAEQIMQSYKEGRVANVPIEPILLVDTYWDLGINDSMSIWFVQQHGSEIRVVDFYENNGQGLPHYFQVMKEKGYIYRNHYAPHDIEVRELSNGKSRRETASSLGINFQVAPKLLRADGIDAVRNLFPRLWFDKTKTLKGLNALKNYHKEFDEKKKCFKNEPAHDWSSHAADAFRTMAVSIDTSYAPKKSYKKRTDSTYNYTADSC